MKRARAWGAPRAVAPMRMHVVGASARPDVCLASCYSSRACCFDWPCVSMDGAGMRRSNIPAMRPAGSANSLHGTSSLHGKGVKTALTDEEREQHWQRRSASSAANNLGQ
eukprot:196638-Chlamydomonas_euryale.AAC.2